MNCSSFYKFFYFKYSYGRVSMGLTISSRKRLFFTVNRQKWRLNLIVKKFQGILTISNLTFAADLQGLLTPKESLRDWKGKEAPIPHLLFISENIVKFHKWKTKTTTKTQHLI